MLNYKEGVCCGCQCVVPLRNYAPTKEESDCAEFDPHLQEMLNYVTIDHEFYGERCEGSSQVPQTIVKGA